MSDRVPLEVTFGKDSSPSEIQYFHNTYGMMKFDVAGGVATINPEWDRLGDGFLKDGFTRTLTTGDVIRSVEALPFIDSVEIDKSTVDEYSRRLNAKVETASTTAVELSEFY